MLDYSEAKDGFDGSWYPRAESRCKGRGGRNDHFELYHAPSTWAQKHLAEITWAHTTQVEFTRKDGTHVWFNRHYWVARIENHYFRRFASLKKAKAVTAAEVSMRMIERKLSVR